MSKTDIKLMAFVASAMFWGSGMAGENLVYIEQAGSSSSNTITIEQVGASNWVGGTTDQTTKTVSGARSGTGNSTIYGGTTVLTPAAPSALNYATITGNTNTLAITQTGDNNTAQYNITGNRNSYTSTVSGSNNQTKLTVNPSSAVTSGTNASVTETITGDNNTVIQSITAPQFTSITSITGNYNQITSDNITTGALSRVENTVDGNQNVFNIKQADTGVHTLVMNTTGDYNAITTQQEGSTSSTFNIKTTGSYNTITVRSSNTTIGTPMTAIAR